MQRVQRYLCTNETRRRKALSTKKQRKRDMAKAEASVEELVGMIERGELRLPEMQRQYVWRSTRVRDLLCFRYDKSEGMCCE